MQKREVLAIGARELAPILVGEGFSFVATEEGSSSGGDFASGEYRRGDRRLELHFRFALGLVTYHVGDATIGHSEYVRAVCALDRVEAENSYPGFQQDALAQFRALGDDLHLFGARFLRGTKDQFQELRDWLDQHPRPTGFAAIDDVVRLRSARRS